MVLTGTSAYSVPVLLILASFPLYNLAGVLGYVLQGLADIKRLTWANVATAGLALIVLVPMTFAFGLVGAIAAVFITSTTQAALFLAAVWSSYRARRWPVVELTASRTIGRQLLGYGGIMIIAGAAQWGSLLVVRTIAVRRLGQYDNGIYQVAYGLSSQYMTIFMTWMGAYVFPRVAGEGDRQTVPALLNSALRANLFLMVPGLVAAIGLRDPLIRLFYSSAFLAASPLIPIQAVGDLARVVGWSYGVSLFAQGHTRAYLVTQLLQAAAWVGFAAALMPIFGIRGIAVGYTLSYLTWPPLMYLLSRQLLDARIDREGVALVGVGAAAVAAAMVLPQPYGLLAAPLVPGLVYILRRARAT